MLETTTNVWDIYDIVAPLVGYVVMAHAGEVRHCRNAGEDEQERYRTAHPPAAAPVPAPVWALWHRAADLGRDLQP